MGRDSVHLGPAGPLASASIRGGEHGQTELTLRGGGRLGPVALSAGATSFNCLGDTIGVQAQHGLEIFHNRLTYGAEYVFNRYDGIVLIPRVHYEHRGGFYIQDEVDLSGILRESAGADLNIATGLNASLRAFYTDSYRRELPDMESVLEPSVHIRMPAVWYLNARLAWQLSSKPHDLTLGVEGFDILGFVFRQHAGRTMPNGPDYAAERLSRRLFFFLRGQIW